MFKAIALEDKEDLVGERDVPEVVEPSESEPVRIFGDEEDMPDKYYIGMKPAEDSQHDDKEDDLPEYDMSKVLARISDADNIGEIVTECVNWKFDIGDIVVAENAENEVVRRFEDIDGDWHVYQLKPVEIPSTRTHDDFANEDVNPYIGTMRKDRVEEKFEKKNSF